MTSAHGQRALQDWTASIHVVPSQQQTKYDEKNWQRNREFEHCLVRRATDST